MKYSNDSKQFRRAHVERERQKFNGIALPKEKIIEIDKKVRKKLREDGFTISSSGFVDNEESKDNVKRLEDQGKVQFEEKSKDEERALTYEEWMNKKNAEAMYRKMMLEAEKQEQEKLAAKREAEKKKEAEQRKKAVREWNRRKREEAYIKKIMEEQKKEKEEHKKEQQRERGEEKYQEWLEKSVKKMQEEQERRWKQRKDKAEQMRKTKREKMLKKEKVEKCYQDWLKQKDQEKRIKEKERRKEERERQRSIKTLNKIDDEVQQIMREAMGEVPKRGKSSRSKLKKSRASPNKTDESKSTKKSRSKSTKHQKISVEERPDLDGNYENIYERLDKPQGLNKKHRKAEQPSPERYVGDYSDDQENSRTDQLLEDIVESALRNEERMTSKYK
eukprot:TRINITY_DN9896_c0_g2_i7.p1 TRINITY_DN9896_c0_g2~~TRINITY_DN9896_c0_g2_i7.p1  ORF type:complete len:390 (+),score=168.30 TRINITY_DN9896_c0_g2_i7:296-1465(+)